MDAKNIKINVTDRIVPQVAYEGLVSIEYYLNGKKIKIQKHNTGQASLFTGISRFLAGISAFDYIPTAIQAYCNSGQAESPYRDVLINPIHYNTQPLLFEDENKVEGDGDSNTVQYAFLIQNNSLKEHYEPITKLALLNDKKQICAELLLGESDSIPTNSVATNIIIYWKLKIGDILNSSPENKNQGDN